MHKNHRRTNRHRAYHQYRQWAGNKSFRRLAERALRAEIRDLMRDCRFDTIAGLEYRKALTNLHNHMYFY